MAPLHCVVAPYFTLIHVDCYFCLPFDLCGGNGRQFDASQLAGEIHCRLVLVRCVRHVDWVHAKSAMVRIEIIRTEMSDKVE